MKCTVTAGGYFIPKDGKYSDNADRIRNIMHLEDFMCRQDCDLPDDAMQVYFFGWDINVPQFEEALGRITKYVSDGCIEAFDNGSYRYTRWYFSKEDEAFRSFSERFDDAWYDLPPVPPEDAGLIKGLLEEAAENKKDLNALRLLSRFDM